MLAAGVLFFNHVERPLWIPFELVAIPETRLNVASGLVVVSAFRFELSVLEVMSRRFKLTAFATVSTRHHWRPDASWMTLTAGGPGSDAASAGAPPRPSALAAPGAPVRNQHEPGKDIWALKDVSFEVKQGEVLGIIGRNGAGKSTLLEILSRVTAPTAGRGAGQRPHRQPAGSWHRVSSGVDRPRKHLPQWRHPRHDQD